MTTTLTIDAAAVPPLPEDEKKRGRGFWVLLALAIFLLVSGVRVLTGAHDIDSSGALRAAIVGAVPIALAGLGGLWSERAGVVSTLR